MRKYWLLLGLFAASLIPAGAQVSVEITLPQDQFLPAETLVAVVRITNRSGQKLHLGAEEDWLTFGVESRTGSIVAKLSDPPVAGEFDLESSKVAIRRVDIAPYFTLSQSGRYSVTATVKIKGWDHDLTSPAKSFDIIHGAKLLEQDVGLPLTPGTTNTPPEVRKYILEQANYLKAQLRLYLRVTDASGSRTLRVFPIGQMISFSRPEAQVDNLSDLHVLYANGPHSFSYTVFNPDGELVTKDTYDYISSRPRLRVNLDGEISVAGGVRRRSGKELSANKPAAASDESSKAKP
jgi:hypothetical protein